MEKERKAKILELEKQVWLAEQACYGIKTSIPDSGRSYEEWSYGDPTPSGICIVSSLKTCDARGGRC